MALTLLISVSTITELSPPAARAEAGSCDSPELNVWTVCEIRGSAYLKGIDFVNADLGMVVGSRSCLDGDCIKAIIRLTDDGGLTWTDLPTGLDEDHPCKRNPDPPDNPDEPGEAACMKTTTVDTARFHDVAFVEKDHAFVVGHFGKDGGANNIQTILATIDGGDNWERQPFKGQRGPGSNVDRALRRISCTDRLRCHAVGGGGTVVATSSGGVPQGASQGWFTQASSTDSFHFASGVSFVDSETCAKDAQSPQTGIDFESGCLGAVSSNDGSIRITRDGGRTWEDAVPPRNALGLNAELLDVFLVDDLNGWAVGFPETLATVDGGRVWTHQTSALGKVAHAVAFADRRTGWAVGPAGEILATSDGGSNWVQQFACESTSPCKSDSVDRIDSHFTDLSVVPDPDAKKVTVYAVGSENSTGGGTVIKSVAPYTPVEAETNNEPDPPPAEDPGDSSEVPGPSSQQAAVPLQLQPPAPPPVGPAASSATSISASRSRPRVRSSSRALHTPGRDLIGPRAAALPQAQSTPKAAPEIERLAAVPQPPTRVKKIIPRWLVVLSVLGSISILTQFATLGMVLSRRRKPDQ